MTKAKKFQLQRLLVLLTTMLCCHFVRAQPGWQDFTSRYFYTVTGKNGKEISFSRNRRYRIMIDSVMYSPKNIPKQKLEPVRQGNFSYNTGYHYHIRINDLSIALPQKNYRRSGKHPEIKIIRQKDTMYIRQPSGEGSTYTKWTVVKGISKVEELLPPQDLKLRFIAGHYYFPGWAKTLWNDKAESTGKVKVVNLEQENFIVPKNTYNSIATGTHGYMRESTADATVLKNFTRGYFSVNTRTEETKFDRSTLPYKNPNWETPFYPTSDPDIFFVMIGYSAHYQNCTSFKNIFSRINIKENSITQWFPKSNPRLFGADKLYVDSFNNTIYLPIITKEEFDLTISDCKDTTARDKRSYRSEDEGISWVEDKRFQELFNRYELHHFEFLDKDFALGYNRRKNGRTVKRYEIVQGTYYLFKNFVLIDSLKTPDDLYYNSNYNNYRYALKNDTAVLGSWSYDDSRNYGDKYFQPYLVKQKDQWRFSVEEKILVRSAAIIPEETAGKKDYQHFTVKNKRELVFKNGAGSLKLKNDIVDEAANIGSGYYVLEKGKDIYLVNGGGDGHTLVSFDAGTSWFVYPLPLERGNHQYTFLSIDDAGNISHLTNAWEEGGERRVRKVIHFFSL